MYVYECIQLHNVPYMKIHSAIWTIECMCFLVNGIHTYNMYMYNYITSLISSLPPKEGQTEHLQSDLHKETVNKGSLNVRVAP